MVTQCLTKFPFFVDLSVWVPLLPTRPASLPTDQHSNDPPSPETNPAYLGKIKLNCLLINNYTAVRRICISDNSNKPIGSMSMYKSPATFCYIVNAKSWQSHIVIDWHVQ